MSLNKKAGNQEVSFSEYMKYQEELDELRKQNGIEQKEGFVSRQISKYVDRKDSERKTYVVNRKKYLLLAVFTGWMGGHRFYAHQYKSAILYLLLCWCGIGVAMTLIDLMVALPKPVAADGTIEL